ncbi:hypothetical protein ID866_4650 [Astraeus odoratus]|nr:hypothetical protein ID866_4650 [Astraeus odoratus]
MFIRASTLLFPVFALSALSAAAPESIVARTSSSSCSNGTLQCCNQTFTADQTGVAAIEGLLGVVVDAVVGPLLGIGCSPITIIGVGSGSTCTQQTVCCQNTEFNGLVNVGCTAISL